MRDSQHGRAKANRAAPDGRASGGRKRRDAPNPRVRLVRPTARDAGRFLQAMRSSRALHGRWVRVPIDPIAYAAYLQRCRGGRFESFLVEQPANGGLVGVVNLSQVSHGNLCIAHVEFYGVAGQTGRGLMKAAVLQLTRYAFRVRRLHRLEAYVQPGNRVARGLLRSNGFRYEGLARRFLKLGGRWLDHQRWVLLREDRPAAR